MPDASTQTNAPTDRVAALEAKIDAIYDSVEKTRKYFLWTLIITVVMIIVPLVGIAVLIPKIIGTYSSLLTGL